MNQPSKPPYRVPLMEEIHALPKNGFTVVSTFSGCGGSCLGFEMAAFKVLWASEFIPAARETYKLNHPGVILDDRDIRTVQAEDILTATGLKVGELDVFEGSPPCASFSTSGKRHKLWGQEKAYSSTRQRTDDLFFEYARLLNGLQPKMFVAENVSGLVKGTAKGYFLDIFKALRDCGYDVRTQVLDAQWLGVPQMRQRVIFIGTRNDLKVRPEFPKPLPYRYALREAIPCLDGAKFHFKRRPNDRRTGPSPDKPMYTVLANDESEYEIAEKKLPPGSHLIHDTKGKFTKKDFTDEPCPAITVGTGGVNSAHYEIVGGPGSLHKQKGKKFPSDKPMPTITTVPHQYNVVRSESDPNVIIKHVAGSDIVDEHTAPSIDGFKMSEAVDELRPGQTHRHLKNLVRPDLDRPCNTVTQTGGSSGGTASVIHPTERRKFTIAELKRICAFPDDFILTGSYKEQWERLGRAVPPVMMFHIAKSVEKVLRETSK